MIILLQLMLMIVWIAFVILAIDIVSEKLMNFIKRKKEQQRLEEVKRYASFFSGSRTIQR
ncbi:hypothetical protein BKP45_05110 [Anaerobacillus alkalidiazotrophicus]|uniref:Uncharacterized protein n=1 Tax=Anaerobacillus alkalidiazotrophicus TaxID=472963 RepID=A0A1S2MDW8_9BACI|nr:hypothetical protein [Anaerobacillus alkalidiazotrophicus]OIJ22057.1 hypothetical protein BKP45_05110 [Anaerobacillus alkalidiazotrophicus]